MSAKLTPNTLAPPYTHTLGGPGGISNIRIITKALRACCRFVVSVNVTPESRGASAVFASSGSRLAPACFQSPANPLTT